MWVMLITLEGRHILLWDARAKLSGSSCCPPPPALDPSLVVVSHLTTLQHNYLVKGNPALLLSCLHFHNSHSQFKEDNPWCRLD